jgi:hypothetical protein
LRELDDSRRLLWRGCLGKLSSLPRHLIFEETIRHFPKALASFLYGLLDLGCSCGICCHGHVYGLFLLAEAILVVKDLACFFDLRRSTCLEASIESVSELLEPCPGLLQFVKGLLLHVEWDVFFRKHIGYLREHMFPVGSVVIDEGRRGWEGDLTSNLIALGSCSETKRMLDVLNPDRIMSQRDTIEIIKAVSAVFL